MVKNKKFTGWVLENFPFIESDFDAITMYQIICKIVEKLESMVDDVDKLKSDYSTVVANMEALTEYVNEYLTGLNEVKDEIVEIKANLIVLSKQIEDNTILINEKYNDLKDYVDVKDQALNAKIDNIQIGAISVYDPTTGLLTPLQIVINNIYSSSNVDGLTAEEFDALDLTATAFDAYQITAYDFDTQGKLILV